MVLESVLERKHRTASLWIIYFTSFVQTFGFSITLTAVWPYLKQLEKDPNKDFLGWVIAANPIGQLIFSPLIGWLCTFTRSIRLPSIFCLLVFIVSNLWYAFLPVHPANAQYFMMGTRFLIGASSGSVAACRTFVAHETRISERTPYLAYVSLAQGLGFTVGQAIQGLLSKLLGPDEITLGGKVTLSMYTGPAWIAAFLGLINLLLFHPKLLHEYNIAVREYTENCSSNNDTSQKCQEVNWSKLHPDYVGLGAVILSLFVFLFNFTIVEVLGTPVLIDQLGLSDEEAVEKFSITMALASFCSIFLFYSVGVLSRRFDERHLLVFCGILPLMISRIFFYPFPGPVAPMERFGCLTPANENSSYSLEEDYCESRGLEWTEVEFGCPKEQKWCFEVPALRSWMLLVGYSLGVISYPFCFTLPQTLYCKILGPRPQGTWSGALSGVISLSRIVGSLLLVCIYQEYGTGVTTTLAFSLLLLSLFLCLTFHGRIVPFGGRSPSLREIKGNGP